MVCRDYARSYGNCGCLLIKVFPLLSLGLGVLPHVCLNSLLYTRNIAGISITFLTDQLKVMNEKVQKVSPLNLRMARWLTFLTLHIYTNFS